jgi:hypothetical protein
MLRMHFVQITLAKTHTIVDNQKLENDYKSLFQKLKKKGVTFDEIYVYYIVGIIYLTLDEEKTYKKDILAHGYGILKFIVSKEKSEKFELKVCDKSHAFKLKYESNSVKFVRMMDSNISQFISRFESTNIDLQTKPGNTENRLNDDMKTILTKSVHNNIGSKGNKEIKTNNKMITSFFPNYPSIKSNTDNVKPVNNINSIAPATDGNVIFPQIYNTDMNANGMNYEESQLIMSTHF